MEGSSDSDDFFPEIPATEKNAIPLDCWNKVNLSDVWVPSHLLPNRSKPSNMKDSSKYAGSFSVYSADITENGQGMSKSACSQTLISKMEGSTDSLDFPTEIAVTERNAIPLDCSKEVKLSDIWIPSHLLPNRSKRSNMKGSSTYASFSVYSSDSTENEQGAIAISDSDGDINPKEGKRPLNSKDNLIVSGRNSPYLGEACQEENTKMNSNENLINMRSKKQNDSRVCATSPSNSINTGSQKHFDAITENHE